MTFCIRVEANAEVALGHLKRSLALAQACRWIGMDVALLCTDGPQSRQILESENIPVQWLADRINRGEDGPATIDVLAKLNANGVAVDSYAVEQHYLDRMRQAGGFIVYLDDLGRTELDVDCVINGSPSAHSHSYRAQSRLVGLKHLILARDYWDPPARGPVQALRNCLITMGGIDHYGNTELLIQILEDWAEILTVNVIIGPYYSNLAAIEKVAKKCRHNVRLHSGLTSLGTLFETTDLAISAGGTTLYELAAMGVPTLAVCLWENQRENTSALEDKGAVKAVDYRSDSSYRAQLTDELWRLLSEPGLRSAMAQCGQQLVDGKGAVRVAKRLRALQPSPGSTSPHTTSTAP